MPGKLTRFSCSCERCTAETLGISLLAQFPDHQFQMRTIPFVDTLEKAHKVRDEINDGVGEANHVPIVICTMGDPELMEIINQTRAMIIDPFGDILPRLEKVLAAQHLQPGQSHRTANQSVYESRIDAIDYAMIHDDGGKIQNYDEADIILIGVSRSGKTPSCLYLALQFGIKAANYPITEEDMEYEQLPEPLRPFRERLFGLTTDLHRLVNIRQERRPNSRYSGRDVPAPQDPLYQHFRNVGGRDLGPHHQGQRAAANRATLTHEADNSVSEGRTAKLGGIGFVARQVIGHLLGADRAFHSPDHQVRCFRPAHVTQHHFRRQDDRARVNLVLPGVLGCGTVGCLEHSNGIGNIGARRDADAANLRRQRVGNIIAIQIQRRNHVVFLRTSHDLLQEVICDHILDRNAVSGLRILEFAPWAAANFLGAV
jgi:regulator of PEP synthase PpsR (kinase-PPPase family)